MGSVLDVLVGSCLFGCLTFAMWDPRNLGARRELGAIFMGLAVIAIALSFGYNSGFPINPARDFAARLFAVMAGWGTGLFHYYDYYFWIPVVVPHIGCLLGALLYELYIGFHFPYWTFNNESGAAEIVHPAPRPAEDSSNNNKLIRAEPCISIMCCFVLVKLSS
ncbi:unnamed protein product [Notodromas monacha]|uniref:Aquaporin-9 n=1 Tax=Notodromas monacha TaxID=399045 RepID=A0A7R9GJ79_9CRUS|nr:unnamed protein product [Notodromas monacha]CAG0924599.1 unnamed protein product [Notodromas monacha]